MSTKQALRSRYSHAQVKQYLDMVRLPDRVRNFTVNTPSALEFLSEAIKHQLSCVPFENLELHYSSHHTISLDVDHLFHKIVERGNGRGGYCMENNTFFGTILRSLGFQVMPVGARVSSAASMKDDSMVDNAAYGALTHTVNIVTIAEKKYLVDVGFGNRGPTMPVPLEDRIEGQNTGDKNGGNFFRLTREHIPDNTHSTPEQLLWVYGVRHNAHMRHLPLYCFPEVEFLPEDFAMMSYYVSKSPTSWFTRQVVCSKFLLEDGIMVGDITLFEREVKERRYGKSEPMAKFETEQDRIDSLEKYLDVTLSRPEISGIRRMGSEIK